MDCERAFADLRCAAPRYMGQYWRDFGLTSPIVPPHWPEQQQQVEAQRWRVDLDPIAGR
jgi:hypothetical protein